MLHSRSVLPVLVLHLILEQASGAALPNRTKTRREVDWLDQEVFSQLSDPSDVGDLSVGDEGDISRDGDRRSSWSETDINPTVHVPVQNQNQNQNHRKADEKRWKVAPLDPIGRFQIPSFRKRKDKTPVYSDE